MYTLHGTSTLSGSTRKATATCAIFEGSGSVGSPHATPSIATVTMKAKGNRVTVSTARPHALQRSRCPVPATVALQDLTFVGNVACHARQELQSVHRLAASGETRGLVRGQFLWGALALEHLALVGSHARQEFQDVQCLAARGGTRRLVRVVGDSGVV